MGVPKDRLTLLQSDLLRRQNTKDYYAIESLLKGNYLLKDRWRRQMK